jgi:hypothetical protein
MVNRERSKWGLKYSAHSKLNPYLASKAKVTRLDKTGIASFTFSNHFVEFIGMELPMGVSEDRPAYLKIIEVAKNLWVISACYIGDDIGVLLWSCTERPTWVSQKLQEEKQ